MNWFTINAAARAARAVVNAICASRETTRAARETARAAGAAFVATYTKIINYGLSLIEKCDDYCCKTQD